MNIALIGGGLYGCHAARYLADKGHTVTLFDALFETATLRVESGSRASIVNQARVHGGYHYPRSVITARQARRSLGRFREEYSRALLPEYEQVYGVPSFGSKVDPDQFEDFCARIGAPLTRTTTGAVTDRVTREWVTDERAINTLEMMRVAEDAVVEAGAQIVVSHVNSLMKTGSKWSIITTEDEVYQADLIVNCTYAESDTVSNMAMAAKGLGELYSFQKETCMMGLVSDPEGALGGRGFTFMDGPFCSIMPFSSESGETLYSLSSVTYTPVRRFMVDSLEDKVLNSALHRAKQELKLYIDPAAVDALIIEDSMTVVKTLPPRSELNDSREVVCIDVCGDNVYTLMGGKLTAVYEIEPHLERMTND